MHSGEVDSYSRQTQKRRARIGEECITAAGYFTAMVDRETSGKDAVSDILTALFGRSGQYRLVAGNDDTEPEDNQQAQQQARAFLDSAFTSWLGDAEDYTYREEG
jgi:hypothetical protein